MTSSKNSVPVLLIEDNRVHAGQVSASLRESYFEAELFGAWDEEKLYNYKALNPDSQIVIVDLLLNTKIETRPEEGLRLIRESLWPVDRTTRFIVYSEHISPEFLANLHPVEPQWTFVRKRLDRDGRLSDDSLKELCNVVLVAFRYTSPVLNTPSYGAYDFSSPIEQYVAYMPSDNIPEMQSVRECIYRSTGVLDKLARAAAFYTRAGQTARHLAIGVYGSCGRLEMRRESDIECSVYFSSADAENERRQLAVAFWNRITRYMQSIGVQYEGWAQIQDNEPKLLLLRQAVDELGNRFYAVFNRERLLPALLQKEPQVRDRHLQVLTELRAIYNPKFIFHLKRDLLAHHLGERPKNVRTIVGSLYFQELLEQFVRDTRPNELRGWDDIKRFCYRIMNILALRLWLIGQIRFSPGLAKDGDWRSFLENMCDPGVVKVCRFANWIHDSGDELGEVGALIADLSTLIQNYAALLGQFAETTPDPAKQGLGIRELPGLHNQIRSVINQFMTTFERIKSTSAFAGTAKLHPWLFSTQQTEELMGQV